MDDLLHPAQSREPKDLQIVGITAQSVYGLPKEELQIERDFAVNAGGQIAFLWKHGLSLLFLYSKG